MTIKMKCFYDDGNNRYGDQWERLLRDNTCHEQLFTKCFKERTVPQRRETHVLTFHGSKHVNRCVCTDVAGWYRHKCSNNTTHVKCCLDRGGKTVQCRIWTSGFVQYDDLPVPEKFGWSSYSHIKFVYIKTILMIVLPRLNETRKYFIRWLINQ